MVSVSVPLLHWPVVILVSMRLRRRRTRGGSAGSSTAAGRGGKDRSLGRPRRAPRHLLAAFPSAVRESEELLVTRVPSSLPPQILVASDRACRLLGYSSHDLIGQKLTQFFLKPESDVVQALSEEHVEADGHAAVVFGTVVSVGLSAAGGHCRCRPDRKSVV